MTRESKSFEHGNLKSTNVHIYIDFSLRVVAQLSVSKPAVNVASDF